MAWREFTLSCSLVEDRPVMTMADGDCEANATAVAYPRPVRLTPVMRMVRPSIDPENAAATVAAIVVGPHCGLVVGIVC